MQASTATLSCPLCRRTSNVPCMELKEAQATIAAYKRLLTQANLAYFQLDAAGIVSSWNTTAAQAFGVREQDAVGQYLEDIVGERYRLQVTHALSRAQRPRDEQSLGQMRLAGPGASEVAELSFQTVAFRTAEGQFAGAAGLALPAVSSAPQALPAPVGGVMPWRCTLRAIGAVPPQFEFRQLDSGTQNRKDAPCDDAEFQRVVERAVRTSVKVAVTSSSRETYTQPFQSEQLLTFDSLAGGTRYYTIVGVASLGATMPFGGSLEVAEGYVVDVTAMKAEQQEAVKWHERWRALAHVMFTFVLLVDITELRVVSAWGDTSSFGAPMEGRPLYEIVPPDNHNKHNDAFSLALSAPGGVHIQDLPFRNRFDESQQFIAQCVLCSDSGDPSVIFLGARVHRGHAGPSDFPTPPPQLKAVSEPNGSAGKGDVTKTGPRLTFTSLALLVGETGAFSGKGRLPGLPQDVRHKHPPTAPPRSAPPPIAEHPPQAAAAKQGHRKPRSATSSGSERISPKAPPRVIPTRLLLHDEVGQEIWRSAELLLGENLRAKELLTRDSAPRFNMPQQFADSIVNDTHELFVLDAGSGELLQIADLASTSLRSLHRHCNSEGQLTMVISPAGDSEDAFETVPQR